jgi:hypothetical protein
LALGTRLLAVFATLECPFVLLPVYLLAHQTWEVARKFKM